MKSSIHDWMARWQLTYCIYIAILSINHCGYDTVRPLPEKRRSHCAKIVLEGVEMHRKFGNGQNHENGFNALTLTLRSAIYSSTRASACLYPILTADSQTKDPFDRLVDMPIRSIYRFLHLLPNSCSFEVFNFQTEYPCMLIVILFVHVPPMFRKIFFLFGC